MPYHDSQAPQNYLNTCGRTPDQLWGIDDIRNIKPSWHGSPGARKNGGDDTPPAHLNRRNGGKPKQLAIMNGDESDGSMPSLQTVSDSSDEDDDGDEYDDDEGSESDGSNDGYDTDEEDELRDMLREAMDTAVASSDFYNMNGPAPEFDALAEDRKGNPFLKLLGSLRGMIRGI